MRLCFPLQAEQRRSCLERVVDNVSGFSAQLFIQIINKKHSKISFFITQADPSLTKCSGFKKKN
jgi:hypothetical protein